MAKWIPIDYGTDYGDIQQYSQWTDDKAVLWANSGSDAISTTTPVAWANSTAYASYDIVRHGGSGFTAWLTSTAYVINDEVRNSTKAYRCIVDHTSGTFATDLSAGKWQEIMWRAVSPGHTSSATINEPGDATWIDSISYSLNDEIFYKGKIWTALANHTSTAATDQPGVGTSWESKWKVGGSWIPVDIASLPELTHNTALSSVHCEYCCMSP